MGIGDLFKKAKNAAAENKDAVKDGIDKAGDFVDDKTGGKYAEHVDKGQDAARDFVDKLDDDE
ncbi:MAG: antitoxin [Acidimicrobiales bacterium]|jgi:hypothetical protein|nr:antitoxin [Acidimicrobiales bacterium]HLV91283.1 antitoxin [Acidimicrobiia bacterium]